MKSFKENFVVPELYGVSIVLDVIPGEMYSCTCERGLWIRNKACQLIERNRPKTIDSDSIPSLSHVYEAINSAVRYSQFWSIHKKYGSVYSEEIMKEIT